ncbi:MAG: radical SAM protein [Desulfobulbaceae bacterium]|nr:radical SAM protein [Desulfobulbaceae bacterium]
MNHIFGPVNSRRLGRSLGIDLLPRKICNFDCIYCEVGPTTNLTCERKEYVPTAAIIAEIDEYCSDPRRMDLVDVVTVTASGEPTLHSGLGRILQHLKEMTGKPVAVLVNGTNLDNPEVVVDLCRADVVVPSLDSALEKSFRRLNRAALCIDLQAMIDGLVNFSRVFSGELWLEVLIAEGINDTPEDLEAIAAVISRMKLTRVQLNTVVRPPLEKFARPVSPERLAEIARSFSLLPGVPMVEVIAHGASIFEKGADIGENKAKFRFLRDEELIENILQMLQRRPCTAVDINRTFMLNGPGKVEQLLEPLVQAGTIEKRLYNGKEYYQ